VVHLLVAHVCPFTTACMQSVVTPHALLVALALPSSKRAYVQVSLQTSAPFIEQSLLTVDMEHVRAPLVKAGLVDAVDIGHTLPPTDTTAVAEVHQDEPPVAAGKTPEPTVASL